MFISALRRLRDTERPIAFKPWIYQIAKNACIDELRRAQRASRFRSTRDAGRRTAPCDLFSREPGPELAAESKQQLDDLRGAFGGVSELHHRILVLRELEGLSYGQIGARLGMTRPVVESTLFRARRRLAEEYEELISGRRCEHSRALIDVLQGPFSAAARGPRPPPAGAAPGALPVLPAPRMLARRRAGAGEVAAGSLAAA